MAGESSLEPKTQIWTPESYSSFSGAQTRDAEILLSKIQREYLLDESSVIVDIGCGTGSVTETLTQLPHSRILACDADPNMISYAENNYAKDHVDYFVEDIGVSWDRLRPNLRDLEGQVSLVWSNRVLHWVKNKEDAVVNIVRLLRPGGRVYATITHWRDPHRFLPEDEKREKERILKLKSWKEQKESYLRLFTKIGGLDDCHIDFVLRDWHFQDGVQWHENSVSIPRFYPLFLSPSLSVNEREMFIKDNLDLWYRAWVNPENVPPPPKMPSNPTHLQYGQFTVTGMKSA